MRERGRERLCSTHRMHSKSIAPCMLCVARQLCGYSSTPHTPPLPPMTMGFMHVSVCSSTRAIPFQPPPSRYGRNDTHAHTCIGRFLVLSVRTDVTPSVAFEGAALHTRALHHVGIKNANVISMKQLFQDDMYKDDDPDDGEWVRLCRV